jgi:hypothetical protein
MRYGPPQVVSSGQSLEHRWNADDECRSSVLYVGRETQNSEQAIQEEFRFLYGDYFGGFLMGNLLKLATLGDKRVFGLYTIEELQEQPEVERALAIVPGICFFMDAANVWFYGHKSGQLYVYDAETDELEDMGDIELGLNVLLDEWEESGNAGSSQTANT